MLPENIKFYRGKYIIVFYDKTDELMLYMFNNIKEILKFQKKELTRQNINLINVELYRALKRKDHLCKFLTGSTMRVYIVDMIEDYDDL